MSKAGVKIVELQEEIIDALQYACSKAKLVEYEQALQALLQVVQEAIQREEFQELPTEVRMAHNRFHGDNDG